MLRFDQVVLAQGDFRLSADFEIPAGGWTAIVGPSGGGKSTLLSGIAGFVRPIRGQIEWCGQPMTADPGQRPVSMLFQHNNLFPHLTVEQNVSLGLAPKLNPNAAQKEAVKEAIRSVGLSDHATALPSNLSGGQQSRVAIARMLLRSKPLILLDEPFAALGPALRKDMLDLVKQVQVKNNATVLMVSHNLEDWQTSCDTACFVADNVAHPLRPTHQLLAEPPQALRDYLGR